MLDQAVVLSRRKQAIRHGKTANRTHLFLAALAFALASQIGFSPLAAAASNEELLSRIEALEKKLEVMDAMRTELKDLKQELSDSREEASRTAERVAVADKNISAAMQAASEEDNASIKWHFGGFGTADYTSTNSKENKDAFDGGFNPIFLVSYKSLLFWESELEVSTETDGATKLEIEFSNLSLNVNDWLTLTAGKFLSPFGDFQQHLHPTWINKLPDRPAGFMEDGGNEPLTEFGVMGRGAFFLGPMMTSYSIFVGNGPQLSDVAEEGVKYEASGGDVNNNKSIGGRIGLHPWPFMVIGFSAMHANLSGVPGSAGDDATNADLNLQGVDGAFTRGNWDIRGEWIRTHLDSLFTAFPEDEDPVLAENATFLPSTTWHSWYVQAAYRLSGLVDNPRLGNLEPVFRFSKFDTNGFDEFESNDETRWTIGLNYWFTPSAVAKIAFEDRNFDILDDENVIRLQFGFGF